MPKCENWQAAPLGHAICAPACWGRDAEQRVSIDYNEVEEDVLHLCAECSQVVSRDARRHGYKVSARALQAGEA